MLELTCVAIVVLFVVVRARLDAAPSRFLVRLLLIFLAGWAAENSVIHAYGFYAYDRDTWTVFIDQVPLLIIVIWPVVIHSAWDLARHLLGANHPRVALAASALVFADAWLIEPIAVNAGLWRWFEPGLFEVPPIGVFGWAIFAYFAVRVLQLDDARRLFVVIVAPLGTHVLLLVSWWMLFRWINRPVPPVAGVVVAWGVSITLAGLALKSAARRRIPLLQIVLRVPAASFFFVLLALEGAREPLLWPYALAFAPPYLALADLASGWTSVETNG